MSDFTIGTLASEVGVSVETIRFYERRGLLPQPDRPATGYRRYGEEAVAQLRFIRRAKDLGFTLSEISELLTAAATGSAGDILAATHATLDRVDAQIAELTQQRGRLEQLARVCLQGADGCTTLTPC